MGMQKILHRSGTLAGIALLGMTAAPAVYALNLNIWGVGHVSADSVDDGDDTNGHIASNSSRLAFSGDHKLNDALKVVFQYESGVDLTGEGLNDGNGGASSNGQLFTRTRDAFVGLSGDYGTVTVGRVGGLNQWVYDYNLFADQVGDLGNIWGGTGLAGRIDSTAQYISPNLNGFTIKGVYAPDEGVNNTEIYVVKGDYQGSETLDGLKVGAAYMSQGMGSGPGIDDHTAWAVTGSYAFADGAYSIGGGYQSESDVGGVSGVDTDSYTVGGSAGIGQKGTLKAQFTQFNGDGSDADAWQVAVGYDHAIAKNTTAYIAYASTDNDDNVAFTANNYGHGDAVTPLAGDDPSVISLGLVYKFNAAIWPR